MKGRGSGISAFLTAVVVFTLVPCMEPNAEVIPYSVSERAFIESHGPWPPELTKDSSNRVSGNEDAIELGRRLFFDEHVSGDNAMSCATCHDPEIGFTDARETGFGRRSLPRNTLGLVNLRWNRWFGWDGGADTLWAQSLRPMLAPNEMNATAKTLAEALNHNSDLACLYKKSFSVSPITQNPEDILVDVAKALAAFQETLVSARTPFDVFRDALLAGDEDQASLYPVAAQRGLKIFTGKGQCSLCHFGPQFSNGAFGDIGIPFFSGKGKVDKGRYGGIQKLQTSPYSLTGAYNDDPSPDSATKTRHVVLLHRNWGEFKTPSLRNVAQTAPYMHNGTLATLTDVIQHYSEIDEERLHSDGEKILKPLALTAQESIDLETFLQSLSAPLRKPLATRGPFPDCSD